jgi:hypothetical protein
MAKSRKNPNELPPDLLEPVSKSPKPSPFVHSEHVDLIFNTGKCAFYRLSDTTPEGFKNAYFRYQVCEPDELPLDDIRSAHAGTFTSIGHATHVPSAVQIFRDKQIAVAPPKFEGLPKTDPLYDKTPPVSFWGPNCVETQPKPDWYGPVAFARPPFCPCGGWKFYFVVYFEYKTKSATRILVSKNHELSLPSYNPMASPFLPWHIDRNGRHLFLRSMRPFSNRKTIPARGFHHTIEFMLDQSTPLISLSAVIFQQHGGQYECHGDRCKECQPGSFHREEFIRHSPEGLRLLTELSQFVPVHVAP